MDTSQQYASDALNRVQSAMGSIPALSVLAATPAKAQLDAAVTAVQTQSATQTSARLDSTGLLAEQRQAVRTLRLQHMQPIAKFARASLAGAPDFAKLTDTGLGLTPAALVRAARGMATAAAPYQTQLTAAQFPSDALTQLSAAADAVETARNDRSDLKSSGVGATAGIKDALKSGRAAVQMLDSVATKLLNGDAAALAAWRSAKRIVAKPGGVGSSGSNVTPTPAGATEGSAARPVTTGTTSTPQHGDLAAPAAGANQGPSTQEVKVA